MSNTNQTNKSEWISVTDRYPDSADWVLVSYVECGDTYRFPPNVSRWTGRRWESREYVGYEDNDIEHLDFARVTHWMPIPELR